MKKILYIACCLLVKQIAFGQHCEPQGGLSFYYHRLDNDYLELQMEKEKLNYSNSQVDGIIGRAQSCNAGVKTEISRLDEKMHEVVQQGLLLDDFSTGDSLLKKLEKLTKVKDESEKNLLRGLAQIGHSSIFVVVMPMIDSAKPLEMNRWAIETIYPRAAETINNAFVQTLSDKNDNKAFSSLLGEFRTADINSDSTLLILPNAGGKWFVAVYRITAMPRTLVPRRWQNLVSSDSASLVLDLLLDSNCKSQLSEKGLSKEDIDRIEHSTQGVVRDIITDNDNATAKQLEVIEARKEKVSVHRAEVQAMQKETDQYTQSLLQQCDAMKLTIKNKDFYGILNEAKSQLAQRLNQYEEEWRALQNQLVLPYEALLTVSDDVYGDVSTRMLELCAETEKKASLSWYSEKGIKINGQQVMYKESFFNVSRSVNRIWVYPVKGDDCNYRLVVLTQFQTGRIQRSLLDKAEQVSIVKNKLEVDSVLKESVRDMVLVKGGTFEMGTNQGEADEKPVHTVSLTDYYMGRTEVTLRQFKAFIDDTHYVTDAERLHGSYLPKKEGWSVSYGVSWKDSTNGNEYYNTDRPVIHVSYNDAVAYCNWLSKSTGKKFGLPTEAQWEYAACGGKTDTSAYSGSNDIDSVGWYCLNSDKSTHSVARKRPNSLGLYDMTGNVWEWCADWFGADYYGHSPATNPKCSDNSEGFVIRGGSWTSEPKRCRSTYRDFNASDYRSSNIGFRVCRMPDDK